MVPKLVVTWPSVSTVLSKIVVRQVKILFFPARQIEILFLSGGLKMCVSQPAEKCMKNSFSLEQLRFVLL